MLIAIIVLLVIFALQKKPIELFEPYSGQKLEYGTTALTSFATDKAFSAGVCIGENDTPNSNISITGDERAALFSLEDNTVVYSKGMYDRIYPASVTKIMTAILALKYGNMDDVVSINWRDLELESGSQVVGFKIGDKVTLENLMKGLLVHSGNDAAMAIARHIGGSTEKFVEMMNEEARLLGATNTHFVNPSGLHDADHYTTVYDIYLMLNEAVKYDDFLNTIQIAVYDMTYADSAGNEKHVTLDSTDHYLTGSAHPPKDVTVLGGKTGTTDAAGNCLALFSQNAFGQPYISVVVKAADKDTLYRDMNEMLAQIN
ncbi:MAG: D-alanyl-D-alanine carboxypeptidase family protein [Lachnospiraceae bacterium]